MEKFGDYNFKIMKHPTLEKWTYRISQEGGKNLVDAKETFAYEGIARFAAIGHISLLEQGKG
jgi:hypothetical protein